MKNDCIVSIKYDLNVSMRGMFVFQVSSPYCVGAIAVVVVSCVYTKKNTKRKAALIS